MQDQFEDVQRLLRLKRYEQPGDDYFERFLDEFSQRQRAELLRRSSRQVLMDRLSTVWWENGLGRWTAAAAAAACVAVVTWLAWPGGGSLEQPLAASGQDVAPTAAVGTEITRILGDAVPEVAEASHEEQMVADAGSQAAPMPIQVRLTEFMAVADPVEFIAEATLDQPESGPAYVPVVPPGVDTHARPLFESSRLRLVSGSEPGSYIPLGEQNAGWGGD